MILSGVFLYPVIFCYTGNPIYYGGLLWKAMQMQHAKTGIMS